MVLRIANSRTSLFCGTHTLLDAGPQRSNEGFSTTPLRGREAIALSSYSEARSALIAILCCVCLAHLGQLLQKSLPRRRSGKRVGQCQKTPISLSNTATNASDCLPLHVTEFRK